MIFTTAYTQLLLIWSTVFLGLVTAQVLVSMGHINLFKIEKVAPVGLCFVIAAFAGHIL